MSTPLLLQLCNWMNDSPIGTRIRESDNLFSEIETVHVLGIVAMAGTIAIADLRVLGLALKEVPASEVVSSLIRITWVGFAVMAMSGAVLFSAEAAKLYASTPFRIKLSLLALAGANAGLFHCTTYRRVKRWDTAAATPVSARIAAACSLALWSAVIVCGRAIAY